MKMKKQVRLISLLIAFIMVLAVAGACGGNAGNSGSASSSGVSESSGGASETADGGDEIDMGPITLTVFGAFGSNTGIQEDSVSKNIREVTGVTMNLISGEDEELQILLAGGDLPDVVSCGNGPNMVAMIESGQLIPLDDLLDKYGQNLKATIPVALKHNRLFTDPEKKHTYFLQWNVAKEQPDNPNYNGFVGFFTRWDLYKAIGMPEIKNDDDYLSALKQMIDLKPVTDDGKHVFAFSGWTEWGLWPYNISYPFAYGYNNGAPGGSLHLETLVPHHNYLEPDSIFWQGLNFMRKANEMGMFDPEAFTMTADQYANKISTGQVIVCAANWWQPDRQLLGDEAGMFILPGSNPYISQIFPEDILTGYGGSRANCISTNNKYPERSMMLMEYMNSDIGLRTVYNGVQGENWDYVDGVPEFIGAAQAHHASGGSEQPDFYAPGNSHGAGKYSIMALQVASNKALDGYPYGLSQKLEYKALGATPAAKDFAQYYAGADAIIPGQAYIKFVEQGIAKSVPTYPMTMVDNSDQDFWTELSRVMGLCEAYVAENISKFILAGSEAEFKDEVQKAIDYCDNLGLRDMYVKVKDYYSESKALVDDFMAEFK